VREVNIHEAKTHLSRLLRRVAAGEEIVIANRGVPVARLVPAAARPTKRELGLDRGKVWIADDFNAPLPDDMLEGFYGGVDPMKIKHPSE
jgi:prevent-host-death family protein